MVQPLPPRRIMEWVCAMVPLGAALCVFLVAASLLLACFLGYQLHLICSVRGASFSQSA
jgi:hypothetical protein